MRVERLRLACGCVEIGSSYWACPEHEKLIVHDAEDAMEALYAARAAIDRHSIVTVTDGGGVVRLKGIPLPERVAEYLRYEALAPGAMAGYPWCEECQSYHPKHKPAEDQSETLGNA
jgi:hypothetical protein